jgi:hypothetical protein
MGIRRLGTVAVAAAVLVAGCDYGATTSATHVADTSAQFEGLLHNDSSGSLTYWFEYGLTPEMGSRTPNRSMSFASPGARPVSGMVLGLDEGTTYHYRLCARNPDGGGLCGAPVSFTTTAGRDSVQGLGISVEMPEIGYHVGTLIDASSLPDGTDVQGHASTSPGSAYFRIPDEGPVTCLRVDGNRASIGFLADMSEWDPTLPPLNVIVHVQDGGPMNDLFIVSQVDVEPTTCPDPDIAFDAEPSLPNLPQPVTRGDLVVHDHS